MKKTKLTEIFLIKEDEEEEPEHTGSFSHGVSEFDPFMNRGDVEFVPGGE